MPTQVSVKISGPAFRVTAYVINSKILKQLQSATEEDALYEDNPLSVVGNLALRSMRVANGFCIHNADCFDVEVLIGGKPMKIERIGMLLEGCEFHEEFDSDIDKTLIGKSENREPLGASFPLAKNEMLVLEIEDIKLGELSCDFEVINEVAVKDLELGLVALDAESVISDATYRLRLLNNMEEDIRSINFNNQKHDFHMNVLSGYCSDFVLVKRNSCGDWVQVDL